MSKPKVASSASSPELPTEIWHEIAQYLPSAHLARLYPVNRAFLELVLENKYQAMYFHFEKQASSTHCCEFGLGQAGRVCLLTRNPQLFTNKFALGKS